MASRSPTLTQLSRTLIGPRVMQASGGVDYAGTAADYGAPGGSNDVVGDEPLWKKLGFESEQAYEDWVNAPAVSQETPASVTSGAAAAPASSVKPSTAVAPESQPASITVPSQGNGTRYTEGLPEIPPSTVQPPVGVYDTADATAGFAGPGEAYTPPAKRPSLLGRLAHAAASAANIAIHQPTGFTATGTGIQQGPSLAQINKTASVPGEIAGQGVARVVPGAPGRIIGQGVQSVLSPVNLAFTALAPEAAIPKLALSSFLSGAASQGAKEAGAPGIVQTGAGVGAGFLPGLAESGARAASSVIKSAAERDLTSELKDATVQTVAKAIANAKDPEDVVGMIKQLDYAQRMALSIEVGQGDKAKMLEIGRLVTAAEQGDAQAAKTLQSSYFKAEARAARRLPFETKPKPGWSMRGPIASAVAGSGAGDEVSRLQTAYDAARADLKNARAQLKAGQITDLRFQTLKQEIDARIKTAGMQLSAAKKAVGAAAETGEFTPSNPIERALGRSLSQSEQEYINGLPPDRQAQLFSEASAPGAAEQAAQMGVSGETAPPAGPEVSPPEVQVPAKTPADAAAEAAAAPPEATPPPTPPEGNAPLGTSGGGSLDRNLTGLGLDDGAKSIVQRFWQDFQGRVADLGSGNSVVRRVTSAIGGDLQDPKLAELVNTENQLKRQLAFDALSKVVQVNTEGMAPEEAASWAFEHEQDVKNAVQQAEDATRAFRDNAVKTLYQGADRTAALKTLAQNDAKLASQGKTLLDSVQNAMKEWRFGIDLGTTLQQGLKASRTGATTGLSGLMGRLYSHLTGDASQLGIYPDAAVDHAVQRASDGLIEGGARTVGIEGGTASIRDAIRNASGLGKVPAALTALQYSKLDQVRRAIYEGGLYQAKLFGQDITNPVVRRQIADYANQATSTARTATEAGRNLLERRILLSPQITRAQYAEAAQLIKAPTSVTNAILAANQLASTAATFSIVRLIESQIGVHQTMGDFLSTTANPLSRDFGKITLQAKDSNGKHIVWSFLPQFSLESAVLKSVQDLRSAKDGQSALTSIADAAAKYGFGRLNIGLSMAANIGGFGYDYNGKFHYGDMPMQQRLGAVKMAGRNLPGVAYATPLSVSQPLTEGATDPYSIGASFFGGNTYGASDYSTMDRLAQQQYGSSYFDLPPVTQAQLNLHAVQDGEKLDASTRAGPYEYASNGALTYVQKELAANAQARQQLQAGLQKLGMEYDILDYQTIGSAHQAFVDEAIKAGADRAQAETAWTSMRNNFLHIDDVTKQMQQAAVKADPQIAVAVMQLYNSGDEQYEPPDWIKQVAQQLAKNSGGP